MNEFYIAKITTKGQVTVPMELRKVLNVVLADPDDNKIIECAIEGKSNYIVSGDKHLLQLREYEGI